MVSSEAGDDSLQLSLGSNVDNEPRRKGLAHNSAITVYPRSANAAA